MQQEVPAIHWSAYEHEHTERESDWFWALGIAAVSIALISVILDDIFFGIFIIIAAFTLALFARRPPELVTFAFWDKGLSINETFHRYEEITAFWIDEEHHSGYIHLLLETQKLMSPSIIIPITEDVDTNALHAFLIRRVQEKPMKEPLAHRIIEFLGL